MTKKGILISGIILQALPIIGLIISFIAKLSVDWNLFLIFIAVGMYEMLSIMLIIAGLRKEVPVKPNK